VSSLFAFDFDGVLFDTARECLDIAWETSRDLPFATRWHGVAEPPAEVERAFLQHRYWVGPPWQYAVLLEGIATGKLPPDTDAFLGRARTQEAALSGFTEAYFATRTRLAADPDRWLRTVRAHDVPATAFTRLHRTGEAVILSTRDAASIQLILSRMLGIDDAVQLERGGPRPKWQILAEAAEHRGLSHERVYFIDDHPHHALPAHEHGFTAHLALWGYNSPTDVAACRLAGLSAITIPQLDATLSAHSKGRTP